MSLAAIYMTSYKLYSGDRVPKIYFVYFYKLLHSFDLSPRRQIVRGEVGSRPMCENPFTHFRAGHKTLSRLMCQILIRRGVFTKDFV